MTTKLLVRQGGASAAEVDYAALTPRSGAPYLEGNTPLIQVGQAFDNGNSAQGIFKFVDPTALVTALGGLKMKPWAEVKLTEDASGDELILGWMRLTGGDAQRRTLYVPGDDVDLNMQITDCNLDLRGIPFVDGWNRPAETDWERLEALQLVKLNGSASTAPTVSRDSTDITVLGFAQGHLVERNTPVTLDAVDYPAGTEVADIIADIAEQAGKEYGVVLHHDGGSTHKCLLYVDQEDLDRWQSAVRISDDVADWDPDDPTAPTFEPHWLQGAGNEADFQTVASGVISVWSGTNDNPRTVTVENSGAEADDEVWWVVYNDGESKTETQATRRATWQLADRKLPHNHYKPSILVKAEQAHLVTAGQAIQVKSAVLDRRGPDLTTFKWRRVKQVIIEPAANGLYWLHLSLERTNFRGRSGGPAQPKSTSPRPAPEFEPDPGDTLEKFYNANDAGGDATNWDGVLENQGGSGNGANGTDYYIFKSNAPDRFQETWAFSAGDQLRVSGYIGCDSDGQLTIAFTSLAPGSDGGFASTDPDVLAEHIISPPQPGHEHAPEWTLFTAGPFTAPVGTTSVALGRTAGVSFDELSIYTIADPTANDEFAFNYGDCPHESPHFLPADYLECKFGEIQEQLADLTGGDLGWFNVKNYGALGDGSTDDTIGINEAISDLNSAGAGVLYFPYGTYIVSSALTAITAAVTVLGDGGADLNEGQHGSTVKFTSSTAVLFTINTSKRAAFEKIALLNDTTATNGAAISVAHASYNAQRVVYHDLTIHGFYIGLDVQSGSAWSIESCLFTGQFQYSLKIRNTNNDDVGDWAISNSYFTATSGTVPAAIRIESSGGGKIVNTKINAFGGSSYTQGIDLSAGNGISTVILLVSNCSIENVSDDGIHVTTTGTGTWPAIAIHGCEFGLWGNNSGYAVSFNAASAGNLSAISVANNIFITNGTARSAVEIINVDNITLAGNVLDGFDDLYDATTSTNITVLTAAGATTLDGLSDVTITAAATGDMLRYNGTAWVDTPGRWEPVTDGVDTFVWDGDEIVMAWKDT